MTKWRNHKQSDFARKHRTTLPQITDVEKSKKNVVITHMTDFRVGSDFSTSVQLQSCSLGGAHINLLDSWKILQFVLQVIENSKHSCFTVCRLQLQKYYTM